MKGGEGASLPSPNITDASMRVLHSVSSSQYAGDGRHSWWLCGLADVGVSGQEKEGLSCPLNNFQADLSNRHCPEAWECNESLSKYLSITCSCSLLHVLQPLHTFQIFISHYDNSLYSVCLTSAISLHITCMLSNHSSVHGNLMG